MRLPSRKTTAISLGLLVLVWLLATWLLLPRVLQFQAERYIVEKSGHHLAMERPEFNPFTLKLTLRNLRLTEPQGAPLLAFRELVVDLSSASLVRRAWVFDAIRLDGLDASLVQLPGGRLNWSALIEALQSKSNEPSPLPRLEIADLAIVGSHLSFADRRSDSGFATRIEPLDLHFQELSTLPDDKGRYRLAARTDFGANIQWQGELMLNPLAVSGHVDITGVALGRLAGLVRLPPKMAPPEAIAALSADYRVSLPGGQVDLVLDKLEAKLSGVKLRTRQDAEPLLSLDSIALKGGRFDLRQHSISAAALTVEGGAIKVTRDRAGRLDLLDLLPQPGTNGQPATPADPAAAPADAWHYRVEQVALTGLRTDFRDQTLSPAAEVALRDITIALDGVSEDLSKPWPLRASLNAADGGRLEAEGEVTAGKPAADLAIKLSDLSLKPAQAWLGAATTLNLASGAVSAQGKLHYAAEGIAYSGSAEVARLHLVDTATKSDFMTWKSLATRKLEVGTDALHIGELVLSGLDTQLMIAKDRSINLSRVVRQSAPPASPAPQGAAGRPAAGKPFRLDIDRLGVVASEMDFADLSLALPFGTRIHHLRGTVDGLSSRPGARGELTLDGQVDDYGLARAAGQINLLDPTDFMDLRVIFRNIEMTRLTPYSATFAGRKIRSGKLSLDLDYKLKQRQMVGDNKILIDKLVLGERVESPQAKDLPLDLAIALLEDSDGRIDLGLPVSGSLDDPQFSFGGLVWKAITNVLTRIVTSPFRALAAIFGSGDEALEHIAFDAGHARLSPPEREKLVRLAATLNKRPALALTVQGTFAAADRVALQDQQLRRALGHKLGYQVDEQRDPGPMPTGQPKVQEALEDLFAERLGSGELAALKDGFRKANPGQLEESRARKLISGLSGVFREKRELSADEVDKLKGIDFYALLYQRLRERETVPDGRLQALAVARGESALADLKAAGAPAERVLLKDAEKVDAKDNEVPLKLGVASAASKSP